MQVVPASRTNEVAEGLISGPVAATMNGRKARPILDRGQLTIRLAKPEEAAAIAVGTRLILDGTDHISQARFDSANEVGEMMARGKILLAEKDDRIVGFAYLEPRLEASRLDVLAVSPSERRTGIGSQLLYAAETLSSRMRCLFMHIQVMNLHWETIKFCRRRGYFQFGIAPLNRQEPVSPHCHIVRLCKQLDADQLAF